MRLVAPCWHLDVDAELWWQGGSLGYVSLRTDNKNMW
jgi:hypothetical protein